MGVEESNETSNNPNSYPNETTARFAPNFGVGWLSLLGIVGFMVGCLILYYPELNNKNKQSSVFHEVVYKPQQLAIPTIKKAKDSLEILIRTRKQLLKDINDKIDSINKLLKDKPNDKEITDFISNLNKDKSKLEGENNVDTLKFVQLNSFSKYYEDLSPADSQGFYKLNKAFHFDFTQATLHHWESAFNKDSDYSMTIPVRCFFKDPDGKITDKIGYESALEIKPAPSDIDFFDKYPAAATWMLLIFFFCSFCFISVATCINHVGRINRIFQEENMIASPKVWYGLICVIAMVIMWLLFKVWHATFFDDPVIKNIFFMKNMSSSLDWIIRLGSIAGAFCIAGFVYSASMLSAFVKPLIRIRKQIKQQQIELKKADAISTIVNDQLQPDLLENKTALVQKQEQESKQAEMVNKLAVVFRNYFILASINLSLTVFCTGALYNAINSLDFVKLLTDDWGYSPMRDEFVYFYGILFTILLMLVYVPAKLRFAEVDKSTPPTGETNTKWNDFLNGLFSRTAEFLVAASPLLTSFVHSLLGTIMK